MEFSPCLEYGLTVPLVRAAEACWIALDRAMDLADDLGAQDRVETHIPMGRAGTADEMAGMACFLAGDDAGYTTGQTLDVDGALI